MAKTKRDRDLVPTGQPPKEHPELPSSRAARVTTLAGMLVVIFISALNWAQVRRVQRSLDERLGKIDDRLTQLASRAETGGAAAARRGPDPNKVYGIKTDGSPALGPAGAPVTIAEFSDFQ